MPHKEDLAMLEEIHVQLPDQEAVAEAELEEEAEVILRIQCHTTKEIWHLACDHSKTKCSSSSNQQTIILFKTKCKIKDSSNLKIIRKVFNLIFNQISNSINNIKT